MKCAICGHLFGWMWSWQPFGPDDDIRKAFAFPGHHYRTFWVVKVCEGCKRDIQNGCTAKFESHGNTYAYDAGAIRQMR